MATAPKTAPAAKAATAKAAPTEAKKPETEEVNSATLVPENHGLRAAPTEVGKRRTAFPEGSPITVHEKHLEDNPKRAGSGARNRFLQYQRLAKEKGNGKFTVKDVLDAGVQPSDIRYNMEHGFITIDETHGKKLDEEAAKAKADAEVAKKKADLEKAKAAAKTALKAEKPATPKAARPAPKAAPAAAKKE